MRQARAGFTLLEVALAIGVLVVGLTAIVSVYMVSLGWASEIRIDLTALQTARIVIADAGVLADEDGVALGHTNRTSEASGWVNDYYVVRTFDVTETETLPNNGGDYIKVQVQVYFGGDANDGTLVQRLFSHQIVLKEYNP